MQGIGIDASALDSWAHCSKKTSNFVEIFFLMSLTDKPLLASKLVNLKYKHRIKERKKEKDKVGVFQH